MGAFAAFTVLAVFVLSRDQSFPVGVVLLFGTLAVLTAQRHVRLSSQMNLSPSFMVAMAAIVVCVAHGSLFGAMLVTRTWKRSSKPGKPPRPQRNAKSFF